MKIPADLAADNPWWTDPSSINRDKKITDLEGATIVRSPRIGCMFDFTRDLVYSLRGPRQVGKTTLIKLQIRQKLEEGVSPRNIMYYAFDVDATPKEVANVVGAYLEDAAKFRKGGRCYIFLDEISAVKEWHRGIKRLWDQGLLTNCTVITTGSNAADIKMASERMPARRGVSDDVPDKTMLPMKFSEFVMAVDGGGPAKEIRLAATDLRRKMLAGGFMDSDLHRFLERFWPHVPALNRRLMDYLVTGGIPGIVNEYLDAGVISQYTFKTHLDDILGDLQSMHRSTSAFKQLAHGITKTVGHASSWSSLQKYTDIGSTDTISSYVDMLQNMFVLSVFYRYDMDTGRGQFRKEKKIHIRDPFYFHVLNGWIDGGRQPFDAAIRHLKDDANVGSMVEGVVASHLIRLAFGTSTRKQIFEHSDHLFYWKDDRGREVDFVYSDGTGVKTPIEVKFQDRVTARDMDGLNNFKRQSGQKAAMLLSKDTLSTGRGCAVIPVSLFLMMV